MIERIVRELINRGHTERDESIDVSEGVGWLERKIGHAVPPELVSLYRTKIVLFNEGSVYHPSRRDGQRRIDFFLAKNVTSIPVFEAGTDSYFGVEIDDHGVQSPVFLYETWSKYRRPLEAVAPSIEGYLKVLGDEFDEEE